MLPVLDVAVSSYDCVCFLYFLPFRLQNTRVRLLLGKAWSETGRQAHVDLRERAATSCHLAFTAPLIPDFHQVLHLP